MGSEDRWAYPEDGESPVKEVEVSAFSIGALRRLERRVLPLRRGRGVRHRRGAVRVVVRLRGLAAGRIPAYAGRRAGALVAESRGGRLATSRGTALVDRRASSTTPSSTSPGRCGRVLRLGRGKASDRGGVGARRPRRAEGKAYPWGDELEPGGEHRMNVWQGDFPSRNTAADGFEGTAPVTSFPPNGYGLFNTTGNVWEWTADWFHPTFRQRDRRRDPAGPAKGTSRVQKGGSYLCHHSYCRRYRVAARQGSTPDSSTGNVGFRCARDS